MLLISISWAVLMWLITRGNSTGRLLLHHTDKTTLCTKIIIKSWEVLLISFSQSKVQTLFLSLKRILIFIFIDFMIIIFFQKQFNFSLWSPSMSFVCNCRLQIPNQVLIRTTEDSTLVSYRGMNTYYNLINLVVSSWLCNFYNK